MLMPLSRLVYSLSALRRPSKPGVPAAAAAAAAVAGCRPASAEPRGPAGLLPCVMPARLEFGVLTWPTKSHHLLSPSAAAADPRGNVNAVRQGQVSRTR